MPSSDLFQDRIASRLGSDAERIVVGIFHEDIHEFIRYEIRTDFRRERPEKDAFSVTIIR